MQTHNIIIAAGGTGGHVFPALAVAKALTQKPDNNISIQWLGSQYGMETRLVPKHGYPLHTVSSVGLRGKSVYHLIKAPFLLLNALIQTVKIFRKTKPKAVLAMGGFSAGITGVVAKLLSVPLIIHEQNAIVGSTNRILAKFADHAFEAFSGAFASGVGAETCGNPIVFNPLPKTKPSLPLNILVVGGSLGAQIFNTIVPKLKTKIKITHQTGKGNFEAVTASYQHSSNTVEVLEFIDDMASAYACADLVICRAGAMTISELMHSASASILIPYPYAIDDHQTQNAKILSQNQAGILLPQPELSVASLDEILIGLSPEKISQMSDNAQKLVQKNSAQIVADKIKTIVKI